VSVSAGRPADDERRKTSFSDIRKGAEERKFQVHTQYVERPSSIVWEFACPWCGDDVKAYLWSMSGGGKRCLCGAIFSSCGYGYKIRRLVPMGKGGGA